MHGAAQRPMALVSAEPAQAPGTRTALRLGHRPHQPGPMAPAGSARAARAAACRTRPLHCDATQCRLRSGPPAPPPHPACAGPAARCGPGRGHPAAPAPSAVSPATAPRRAARGSTSARSRRAVSTSTDKVMSSRRYAGARCSSANFTSMAPRCASTAGAMDSTRAAKRWRGKGIGHHCSLLPRLQLVQKTFIHLGHQLGGPGQRQAEQGLAGLHDLPGLDRAHQHAGIGRRDQRGLRQAGLRRHGGRLGQRQLRLRLHHIGTGIGIGLHLRLRAELLRPRHIHRPAGLVELRGAVETPRPPTAAPAPSWRLRRLQRGVGLCQGGLRSRACRCCAGQSGAPAPGARRQRPAPKRHAVHPIRAAPAHHPDAPARLRPPAPAPPGR